MDGTTSDAGEEPHRLRMWHSRSLDFKSAKVVGRWLLHILQRTWLRYIYPALLFAIALGDRGVVLGIVYNLIVIVLVLPAFCRGRCFKYLGNRPFEHLINASVFLLALISRGVLAVMVCGFHCKPPGAKVWKVLGLADVDRCEFPEVLLPEILGLGASLVSAVLSMAWAHQQSSGVAVRTWLPAEWCRFLPVCAVLAADAAILFNMFAVAYHVTAMGLMLAIPWSRQCMCQRCARFVFRVILVVAVLHIAWARFQNPLEQTMESPAMYVQLICTFVLIQVILWEALRIPDEGESASASQAVAESSAAGVVELELAEDEAAFAVQARPEPAARLTNSTRRSGYMAAVCEEGASRLLPLFSFVLWSVSWPALGMLPLLLAGVVLMHMPLSKPPRPLLCLALVYESVFCVYLYGVGAYCNLDKSFCRNVSGWIAVLLQRGDAKPGSYLQALHSFQQEVGVLLLAVAMRSGANVAPPLQLEESGFLQATWQWGVCLLRLATLGAVAVAALSASAGASLIGLGYMLWLAVALPSTTAPGWFALRGSSHTWRALLLYSQAVVIALYMWTTLLGDSDKWKGFEQLVGLNVSIGACSRHITVAVLASMQVATHNVQVVHLTASLADYPPLVAWLFSTFGVLTEMVLVFMIVLQEPKSVVSFLYLVIFIGLAAVEQFRGVVHGRWHRRLYIAIAVMTATFLILMYSADIPAVSTWLSKHLSEQWISLWGTNDLNINRRKLYSMVMLVLHSCCIQRLFQHRPAILEHLLGESSEAAGHNTLWQALSSRLQVLTPPAARAVLGAARGWPKCILLFAAFFLMFRHSVLAISQLLLLLLLLTNVRCWRLVGAFLSVSSMLLLLAQYLFRFTTSQRDWRYWGVAWRSEAVRAEVVLLLLGMSQRFFQLVGRTDFNAEEVQLPLSFMSKFGAHLGIALLALLALFRESAWSLPYLAIVIVFTLRKCSGHALHEQQTRRWLYIMTFVLALALAQGWLCSLWLPAGTWGRPDADTFGSSFLCSFFDSDAFATSQGSLCEPSWVPSDCHTQRFRCGEEWQAWLGLSPGAADMWQSLPEFAVLFVVCLARKACLQAALQGAASGNDEPGFLMVGWSALLMSLSLVGTFTLHSVTNAVSIAYALLLFGYFNTVHTTFSKAANEENVLVQEDCVLHIQACALRRLRRFNLFALALLVIFKVPSTLCPYELGLQSPDMTGIGPFPQNSTLHSTNEQCSALQSKWSSSSPQITNRAWVSTLLQCIGVYKGPAWPCVWNWLIFASSLAHVLACSRVQAKMEAEVSAGHGQIERRRALYTEHLRKWCRLELESWDMKQRVLLLRLELLMKQLRELREVWEDRRGAPREDTQERQKRTARVLDLWLQSGASWTVFPPQQHSFESGVGLKTLYDHIDVLLRDFDQAAAKGLLQRSSFREQRIADEAADEYLLQYIQERQSAIKRQLQERAVEEGMPDCAEDLKLRKLALCEIQVAGSETEEPRRDRFKHRLHHLCIRAIDDLLFVNAEDTELHMHRQDDGPGLLLGKALLSQTHLLLLITAVVLFAYSCSVLSAVTVCAVVPAVMAFPHAPGVFWHALQWYTVLVVVAKAIFQLPVFCPDGSVQLQCDRPANCQWLISLGFVKVDEVDWASSGYVVAALWLDMLVCVVLFVHCHVLCQAGRLGSCEEVRARLQSSALSTSSSRSSVELEEPAEHGRMWQTLDRCLVGSARMHKPTKNLYAPRFILLFLCLIIIALCWSSMVGKGRDLEGSLSSNSFDLGQVFAIVLFVALLIADRGLYTASLQVRWGEEGGTARCAELLLSDIALSEPPPSGRRSTQGILSEPTLPVKALVVQRVLLVVQLLAVHITVLSWQMPETGKISSTTGSLVLGNDALLLFYLTYMAYLALTALQSRYNIHVIRGGHMLTHSTRVPVWLLFKLYQVIPFIEELRVLTDWTVTRTSLNFWMWMKTEDAQQSLYQTRCDMEARRLVKPHDPRPAREKILQGAALLLGLYILIVGPIAFFSPLNILVQPNMIIQGELVASLKIQAEEGVGVKTVRLYTSAQSNIRTGGQHEQQEVIKHFPDVADKHFTVQHVTFPTGSDMVWQVTQSLEQQLADLLSTNSSKAYVSLGYVFERNSTSPPASISPAPECELTRQQMEELAKAFNSTQPGYHSEQVELTLTNVYIPALLLDATPFAKPEHLTGTSNKTSTRATLTLNNARGDMSWSIQKTTCGASTCQLDVEVVSLMVSIFGGGSGTDSSSGRNYWSVTGMYSFVLFVVGSFLRSAFKDSSKRMIWEELQDTEVLDGLCNGIYLARMKGQLDKEYTLYYLLVRIYRCPELLFKVSKPKVPLDPDEQERVEAGFGSGRPVEEAASRGLRHREGAGDLRAPAE